MNRARGPVGFMVMGMANGLLPCGMVYIAIAAALSLKGVIETTSFMAMFGTGTLPAMLLISFAGRMVNLQWRNKLRKIVPVFIVLAGTLLILRGLNLGIPFISPVLPGKINDAINCHP
jgi:sulfite exporter TauE/SafE